MIPVLGVPYISRPDLLSALFASIDEPVDRLLVVDNSEDGSAPVTPQAIHIAAHHNLGVAASWNLILKATPLAPWWLLVNADIAFAPGDLARLAATVGTDAGVWEMWGFAAFAINRAAVDTTGLFDENFHPAHHEDCDYRRRLALAGVPRHPFPCGVSHYGNATIKSDERHRRQNDRTAALNERYYAAKWGSVACEDGHERYVAPFDVGGSVTTWTQDFARLRELTWEDRMAAYYAKANAGRLE